MQFKKLPSPQNTKHYNQLEHTCCIKDTHRMFSRGTHHWLVVEGKSLHRPECSCSRRNILPEKGERGESEEGRRTQPLTWNTTNACPLILSDFTATMSRMGPNCEKMA